MILPDKTRRKIEYDHNLILDNTRQLGQVYDFLIRREIEKINYNRIYSVRNNHVWKYPTRKAKALVKKIELTDIKNQLERCRVYRSDLKKSDTLAEFLKHLLVSTDYSLLMAKNVFCRDSQFSIPECRGYRLHSLPKIMPDLIIDNKVIDIKTYGEIALRKPDWIQLILYAVWVNNREIIHPIDESDYDRKMFYKKIKITEIGIFFSLYNYLWSIKLSDIMTQDDEDEFECFCYLNSGVDFKVKLKAMVKQYVEKRFSNFKAR